MDFTGKTALVTGSGAVGGLGHAVAKTLATGGAKVIVTGRDPRRGGQVVDDIGGDARFVPVDLSNGKEAQRLADEVGLVDILVNNAASMPLGATTDQSLREYQEAFAVNVHAPFLLTQALAPKMAANGGGSIVNISSTAAGIGMPGLALYGATKAALESLTRAWAAEFAPGKVRINAVSPGPMLTTKAVAGIGDDGMDAFAETVPMARTADPAEVADVVAFVASDLASFMTGAIVAADGGRTAI
ncbi:SDR family NAD(P)-dependent oxidoreductase [Amycolatopsis sp. GM8]|uniref:SDR family NAD(P)-dependent oxidoreductase n=1 Tax=Amycolatopsis sp. GM8 TaxID=2896530 RepID=UPI0021039625|nr:SDR family oxidoreductase [Amycolatopsis sp. GM8]